MTFPDRLLRWVMTMTRMGMLCATIEPSRAIAASDVPRAMIGTWAHGNCASMKDRLVITPTVATFGTDQPKAIVYFTDDAGPGKGALRWREEYDVDNFVYESDRKMIIHNTQGYNMPGQVYYKRCPDR